MLSKKLSLSAQYTYTNQDEEVAESWSDTSGRLDSKDNKKDISQGALTVGLAYHFNGI